MRLKKTFKSVLLPLFVSLFIFMLVRPAFAQLVLGESKPAEEVEVGVETVNGYSQVYFLRGEEKVFITEGNKNSLQPHSRGEYITYVTTMNGAGQIFLYNISSGSTVQLTNSRTNLKPKVSREGKVVWERWISDPELVEGWQIALFDGTSIRRLTEGETSINPDIDGDYVVFSRKDEKGVWRAVGYSIREDKALTINVGLESKFPTISGDDIFLSHQSEPLKITDIFLLGELPTPTSAPTTSEVTMDDIKEELNSQPIEEEESGE